MTFPKRRPLFALIAVLSLGGKATVRAEEPTPKEIITRAIKAAGWDQSKGDYHAWKDLGKVNFGGMKYEYTSNWKVDGKTGRYRMDLKTEISGQTIEIVSVFDGEKSFESMGDIKREVTGDKLDYTRETGHQYRVISLKPLLSDDKFKLTTVPGKDVDGKATQSVKVEYPNRTTFTLSFDKESGLCVKSEGMIPNEFEDWKKTLDETYFGGWKEAGKGVKYFTTLKLVRNGTPLIESKMSDVTISEKPDWAKTAFEKLKE